MVGHAVLPLEALLADGAFEGLLVRMRQFVAIQVVHVPKGLAAHVTAVVLLHWFGGLFGDVLLLLLMLLLVVVLVHWSHDTGACGGRGCRHYTSHCGDV